MNTSIAHSIVQWVNTELNFKLAFVSITNVGSIYCKDHKDRKHAIVCYGSFLTPVVRSVLRERRAGQGFSWLCNGQAGTNAIEIARWDEDHRYQPTAPEAAEILQEIHGPNWKTLLQKGNIRYPNHLTIEQILEAETTTAASS